MSFRKSISAPLLNVHKGLDMHLNLIAQRIAIQLHLVIINIIRANYNSVWPIMLIQRRISNRAVRWLFVVLAPLLPQFLIYAQDVPHVVIIVGDQMPNGFSRPKQLVVITPNNSTNIADVSHALFFGEDGSTLAFLKRQFLDKQSAPGWHLMVINSLTSILIADSQITSESNFTPEMMMTPLSQLLVVDSKNSEVYFPLFDFQNPHSFSFAEANWKTGIVRTHKKPYEALQLAQEFIPIPSGFAMTYLDTKQNTPQMTAALIDTATQKLRLVPLPDVYGKSFGIRQIFFLPTVGLIEYCQESVFRSTNAVFLTNTMSSASGPATPDTRLSAYSTLPVPVVRTNNIIVEHTQPALFQLTDVTPSTNSVSSTAIPTSNVNSEIFVRAVDGKPCLIWGENSDSKSRFGVVSEIVIFDWNSKHELLRKSLETRTSTFQPNADGSKIYFLDSKDGKIKYYDVGSQTITPFSDEPVPNPADSQIVAAY